MKLSKPQRVKLARAMGLKIATVYFRNGVLITARYSPCWTVPMHNCLDRKFYCRKSDFNPSVDTKQGYDLFTSLMGKKPLVMSKMLSKMAFELKTKGSLKKAFLDSICTIGLI